MDDRVSLWEGGGREGGWGGGRGGEVKEVGNGDV